MKILIIDDDKLVRMTCCNTLRKAGHLVFEADNGNSGIEIFKDERPSLVITDILMPDKEGLETISEIRSISSDVKIIAISGGGGTHNMNFLQMAQRIGANSILEKPFRPTDILASVEAFINI